MLERIAKARARKPRIREERITLSHGAGGKATHTLIEAVFLEAFRNPLLEPLEDGASLVTEAGRLAFTTDSFVVSPLFFPGGDIGDLAVNGTVNDLAMCGARPLYLSCGFILEEGFPVATLQRIVASMAAAARARRGADRHGRHEGRRARQGGRLLHHDGRGRAAGPGVHVVGLGGASGRRRAGVRADRRPRDHGDAGPRRAGHLRGHRLGHRAAARADRRVARRRPRGRPAAARRDPRGSGDDLQRGRGRIAGRGGAGRERACRCGRR